mmetsp:Transcript_6687/g.14432  ORF Transcript_6687/g.14432 Transcript_6687/m.14432 type:complete len:239 (+) Transcript_6687:2012-2728(+)
MHCPVLHHQAEALHSAVNQQTALARNDVQELVFHACAQAAICPGCFVNRDYRLQNVEDTESNPPVSLGRHAVQFQIHCHGAQVIKQSVWLHVADGNEGAHDGTAQGSASVIPISQRGERVEQHPHPQPQALQKELVTRIQALLIPQQQVLNEVLLVHKTGSSIDEFCKLHCTILGGFSIPGLRKENLLECVQHDFLNHLRVVDALHQFHACRHNIGVVRWLLDQDSAEDPDRLSPDHH